MREGKRGGEEWKKGKMGSRVEWREARRGKRKKGVIGGGKEGRDGRREGRGKWRKAGREEKEERRN